jgi:ferredoxin-NADP reductase
MERAAVLDRLTPVAQKAPGNWQIGTVTQIRAETPTVKTIRIALPMWMAHLPGQHYEVRLTAPDGYTAQRSYSIASSPLEEGVIELTIERLLDGEVSIYLHDVLLEGDEIEVRGPFTSYFVWRGESPVLLLGGGSGVVPLMCMLRHMRRTMPGLWMRLVYSVRTPDDVIYGGELGEETVLTYTKEAPPGWAGHTGRIDEAMVAPLAAANWNGLAFVCGTNGFVEAAVDAVMAAGLPAAQIRTERFGPSG